MASPIDVYMATLDPEIAESLASLRAIIKTIVPDAEEAISYQIPSFKYHGMLVGFAAFKNHCSFFVMHGSLLQQFKDELAGFGQTKSAVHFTSDKPIPAPLVEKMVKAKLAINLAKKK